MTNEELKQFILKEKIVVILRKIPYAKIRPVCEALLKGGVHAAEITFNQSSLDPIVEFETSINIMKEVVKDQMVLGAGTVLTKEQVDACKRLGAGFIISPNTNVDLIHYVKEQGLVSIPGAMTPSEIVTAYEAGADIVKVFPINDLGVGYLKSLRAPLSHIPMMATGGVVADNIQAYAKAGADCFGISSSIVSNELLEKEDYEEIENRAKCTRKLLLQNSN